MEKKLNKKINDISIKKDAIKFLNSELEKYVLNSNVLIVVDFLTYKNYKTELESLVSCGLNNLIIKVLTTSFEKNSEIYIDETFAFVCGIGENWLLEKTKNFAIKNNINYGLINLYVPKTSIFLPKMQDFNYFPPCFLLFEEREYSLKEKFFILCDVSKYSYLLLESAFNFKNQNLSGFSDFYKIIISNLLQTKFLGNSSENNNSKILIESLVEVGLLLQKFNINQNLCFEENEFCNFVSNFVLGLEYKNIFLNLNENNLVLARPKQDMLNLYEKLDIKFYKMFLLNFKNKFLKNIQMFLLFCEDILSLLKQNFFEELYRNVGHFDFCTNKINYNNTFLKKMCFFDVFDKVISN